MSKVVTFGELMLRLTPNGYYRFFQNDQCQATFGGAEANVAVSLANFGMQSVYVTKMPTHEIGQAAVNFLAAFGVDTSKIARGGERVGIYYLEKGASQRPSLCVYDRAHSSIQTASIDDFDWDDIFNGADWFHFTGITPALSDTLSQICETACFKAKERGVKISIDTNYRAKLWTLEKAKPVISKLCKLSDVIITNPGDAKDLFGILSDDKDFDIKHPTEKGCQSIAEQIKQKFGCSLVALTLRTNISASDNDWQAAIYDGKECCFSKKYNLHIVDRIGGGDSFCAGLIYSMLMGKSNKDAIEFAVAASALKHSIEGDINRVSVSEVENLAGGNGSGRVQR